MLLENHYGLISMQCFFNVLMCMKEKKMPIRFYNPQTVSPPVNPYSHGAVVEVGSKLLYIAGQVGRRGDGGNILPDFESCEVDNLFNRPKILGSYASNKNGDPWGSQTSSHSCDSCRVGF